jgi:hypothetical protein
MMKQVGQIYCKQAGLRKSLLEKQGEGHCFTNCSKLGVWDSVSF